MQKFIKVCSSVFVLAFAMLIGFWIGYWKARWPSKVEGYVVREVEYNFPNGGAESHRYFAKRYDFLLKNGYDHFLSIDTNKPIRGTIDVKLNR